MAAIEGLPTAAKGAHIGGALKGVMCRQGGQSHRECQDGGADDDQRESANQQLCDEVSNMAAHNEVDFHEEHTSGTGELLNVAK